MENLKWSGKSFVYYGLLEFQGPSGPLENSSPCGGHACSARMALRFARKVTLENLDSLLQTLKNFIIKCEVLTSLLTIETNDLFLEPFALLVSTWNKCSD